MLNFISVVFDAVSKFPRFLMHLPVENTQMTIVYKNIDEKTDLKK